MSYYTIQVEENKELTVKDNILNRIKDVNVLIPLIKNKVKSGNHITLSYERSFPDYLIIECSECVDKIKKISGMTNVHTVFLEEMSGEDIKKLKRLSKDVVEFEDKRHEVSILDGLYSGKSGKLDSIDGDFVFVIMNKEKVSLPIWYIEQMVSIDDLMGRL